MNLKLGSSKIDMNNMKKLPDWQKKVLKHTNILKLCLSAFVLLYCIFTLCKVIPFTLVSFLILIIGYAVIPRVVQHILYNRYRPKVRDDDEGAS